MPRPIVLAPALLLAAATAALPAAAQPPQGPDRAALYAVDPATVPALRRPVRLALRGAPLAQALREIAAQAGLPLTFSPDLLPRGDRVTLAAPAMPAGDALRAVLADAGLEVLALSTGQVVVVRGARPAAQPAAPVRVSGYVRSAATREVVRYASVTAEPAPNDQAPNDPGPNGGGPARAARAEATAEGAYFLRLAPGRYRLRVRAIGFAPLDTALDARASRTLDVALTPRAATLAAVAVTAEAERPAADPRAAAMSVARVDLRTLRQAPSVLGELDPVRSLTLLPGVSRTSDFNTAFNVRGGGADQNLVLLDESTLYNPAHVLGFLSVFNGDAVDDVTLYKGAIPARFGGRLSSVLDVRQRAGDATRLRGSATVGLLASRALAEGPLPGVRGGSFLVAARRSYADFFTRAARDPDIRDNSAYFYDGNAKATLPAGRAGTFTLSGYAGRDRFRTSDVVGADWGNAAGTLRWDQIAGGRLFSKAAVGASNYDYRLRFTDGPTRGLWTAGIRNLDARVDERLALREGSTLEFGGALTGVTVRPGDIAPRGESNIGPRTAEPRRSLASALYVGHELDVGPRVSVRYGARYSAFARRGPATIYQYADGLPVRYDSALGRFEPGRVVDSTRYGAGAGVRTYSALEPRASVRVGITSNASLKASYARTVQYLHLATRTNSPTPLDIWEPSGPYLRPQRADQVAVGYAAVAGGGRWELSAEAYGKRLYDVVDFIDGVDLLLNPRVETAAVQGRGRAAGLELYARRRTGRTTGWVSYTLSRAEQQFRGGPGAGEGARINGGRYYPAPYDKTHDLSVVAVHPLGAGWTLGATFALASGLPATYPVARYQVDGLVVAEFGPRNGARLPLYHRLDLGATRTLRRSELQLGVFNVYNHFNAQSITFRQTERDPLLARAYRLSVFGAVPSVSYTRHF